MNRISNINATNIIITLGWDLSEFWSLILISETKDLEDALNILQEPDEPGMPDYLVQRSKHGIKQIIEELEKRKSNEQK